MGKITALKLADRRGRVVVVFDDASSIIISKDVVTEAGIHTGLDISEERIQELKRRDHYFSCLQAALRYLAHRPRSKMEVENRLRQHRFDSDTLNNVMATLKKKKLIDDESFARQWTENRQAFSPRSQRLLNQELRQKGIDNELSNDATSIVDDEENAYRAGLKKSRLLRSLDHDDFKKRMVSHLRLKGFGFNVIKTTVERLWQEKNETGDE